MGRRNTVNLTAVASERVRVCVSPAACPSLMRQREG